MTGARGSRREYLVATSSTAVGLLTGCMGGGEPARRTTTAEVEGNAALRDELGLERPEYELEEELRVFQWVDYWPRRVVSNFERSFGVSVTVDTYTSNEQLRRTLLADDSPTYDVVFPSDYMVNVLADDELLRPIDRNLIPNWSNLEDRWIRTAPYDPGTDGERYSVPFQWGTTGLAWHEKFVETELVSWDAMWNERFAGQITWLDDVREVFGASLKRLGYSINTRDEEEILEAKEALVAQKDLVKTFDSRQIQDFLINKEATPVHSWSGEASIAYWGLYQDGSSPVQYRIPEEGGVVWVDTAAVPNEARRPNAAHAFVDYLLAARVGAAISNYTRYPTPNAAAKEYLGPEMLDNPNVYPPDDVFEKLEFVRDVGPAIEHYERAWEELRQE